MAKRAQVIRVERTPGNRGTLTIDGEPFPWYIAAGGVEVGPVRYDEAPTVTVTIMAGQVEVLNAITDPDDA